MDSFSPSHAGFQAWSGVGTFGGAGITHYQAERSITPEQLQSVTKAVQKEFQDVFGDSTLRKATQQQQPKRKRGFWGWLGLGNSEQTGGD
jgi:hypothetical protein